MMKGMKRLKTKIIKKKILINTEIQKKKYAQKNPNKLRIINNNLN